MFSLQVLQPSSKVFLLPNKQPQTDAFITNSVSSLETGTLLARAHLIQLEYYGPKGDHFNSLPRSGKNAASKAVFNLTRFLPTFEEHFIHSALEGAIANRLTA